MRAHTILLTGLVAGMGAATAGAQPVARADVTGVIGWFNANQADTSTYNDWYSRSAYGGAGLGWYWTDHLKTEVEVGATSPAELYGTQTIEANGRPAYGSAEYRFSTRRVTAAQHYQFLRNAWAHPHAAAGVDLTWETRQQRLNPIVQYDPISKTSPVVREGGTIGPSTNLDVRPFAEVGAKVYVSPKGFFRTDLRLTFRHGVDEAVLRFGVGVDF